MRKLFVVVAITVMVLVGGAAYADYSTATRNEVMEELRTFLGSESGREVSKYQIIGLMNVLDGIFQKNVVLPKPINVPKKEN